MCLNLLERPSSGEIWFEGTLINDKKCNIDKIRQKMGMVFQHFNLFPHLSVLENITLAPVTLKLQTKEQAEKNAKRLLSRIGLLDKADTYPSMISGGQKQRIAIIRSLAMILTSCFLTSRQAPLDPEMGERCLSYKELANEGMTMVIVTHEMGLQKRWHQSVIYG
jgi:polar amino acid transport system ATP-binding protein